MLDLTKEIFIFYKIIVVHNGYLIGLSKVTCNGSVFANICVYIKLKTISMHFICSTHRNNAKRPSFCILYVASVLPQYMIITGLADVRIEGIDAIALRYKTMVDTFKKKNYDLLDHRKQDFDNDYVEFKTQIDSLQMSLQGFMDAWFARNLTVRVRVIN